MITSSNFFRKTLFGEDDDPRSDWVRERKERKVLSINQTSRRTIEEHRARKPQACSPHTPIFKRQALKQPLPPLRNQLGTDYNRRCINQLSVEIAYGPKEDDFNFLKLRRNRNHRLHDSLNLQKERLRSNTIDKSRKSSGRYPTMDHVRDSKILSRRCNPLDSPDINSRDFMKQVQERLNRIRVSFS